jgi:hypothetical protein
MFRRPTDLVRFAVGLSPALSRWRNRCALLVVATAGCSREQSEVEAKQRPGFVRGDHVVVERAAAEFFEGRVLGVASDKLRVEPSDNTGNRVISSSDAYRLPPSPTAVSAGRFAICGVAAKQWVACRVVPGGGELVRVEDADGRRRELSRSRILEPTPVTELNLRHHFERASERAAFTRGAERAGHPRAPRGWVTMPRERVVARHGVGWFNARVHEIESDGVRVAWESGAQIEKVGNESVVPEPPHKSAVFQRGDYALMRPETPSEPWKPVQVRDSADGETRVMDVNGRSHVVRAHDLLPLVR